MPKKSISACVMAAEVLRQAKQNKVLPVPKHQGWFSPEDYAGENGWSISKAKKDIYHLRKMGKVISQRWPSLDDYGRTYYINIYKLK
jgi:hypothetical protein